MKTSLAGALALFLAIESSLLPALAYAAEPSAEDRTTARALAAEGYKALQAQDYATAADRFHRADELVHAPTLLVDEARALVGLGRLVEAHEAYERALRDGVRDNMPWSWKKAYENAIKEQKALEPRLGWVKISVSGTQTATVKIDGKALSGAAVGVRRAIDPGKRSISAEAPGFVRDEKTVEIAEGANSDVELVLIPAPNTDQPSDAAPLATTSEPEAPKKNGKRTAAYVALGIGGAGLVAGGVMGALALGKKSKLEDACNSDGKCPASSDDDLSAYHAFGTGSAIGFGVGVAGVAVGVSLLLLSSPKKSPASEGAKLVPVVGPSSVGVVGTF